MTEPIPEILRRLFNEKQWELFQCGDTGQMIRVKIMIDEHLLPPEEKNILVRLFVYRWLELYQKDHPAEEK